MVEEPLRPMVEEPVRPMVEESVLPLVEEPCSLNQRDGNYITCLVLIDLAQK